MQVADSVLDEIEETFDRFDENGDRRIAFEEFAKFMLKMDHTTSAQSLRACFDAIDTDRDGQVNFAEFRAWMSH